VEVGEVEEEDTKTGADEERTEKKVQEVDVEEKALENDVGNGNGELHNNEG
jgi:hypothetical protein